jgi:hypothetical protein
MATGNQVLPEAPAAPRRARPRSRRGAGGRWLVWGLRAVVWVVLLLIGYRGVAAIVAGPAASSTLPAPSRVAVSGFPVTLAQAYALQFGDVYLNFSPATAATRGAELAAFLPPGADPQLGWDGAGTQSLQSEQVAGITVTDVNHAIVTLLARVDYRLVELGVPIYWAAGGLVVSGQPALLPPPASVTPPTPPATSSDQATETALAGQLPPFFRAFASGDKLTLDRFLAAGAHVSGLDGAVAFSSIAKIKVPESGGTTRHITVTVVWSVPGLVAASGKSVATTPAAVQMTYAMTVVQRSGSWYVRSIGASAASPGSSS